MTEDRTYLPVADSKAPYFVGIDLGGTGVKFGVVDDLGRTLAWHKIPTEVERGPKDASLRIGKAVKDVIVLAGLQHDQIARVGLASAGTMDIPKGMLIEPGNLPGWENFAIRKAVSDACGLSVTFANDAAAAAYGEYWLGSGRDSKSLLLLTLGTGVGCGIIIDGRSLDGVNSHGAESGHIIVNPSDDARWCNCKQRGHLEAYASATGVTRRMQEMLDSNLPSSLNERLKDGADLTTLMIAEEAEEGDELSHEVILDTARWLGIGIVTLIHTIDPACVLLGGAMTFGGNESELGREFLARVKQEIDDRAFAVLAKRLRLDFASLGGDAGYFGAAGLAREEFMTL